MLLIFLSMTFFFFFVCLFNTVQYIINRIEDGAIADPILEPISLKPVDDIADKLTDLKSPDVIGLTSDEAIAQRLAKLKGIEHKDYSNQNLLFGKETRSAEEQVRDLLKQFVSEQSIDAEAKLPDSELGQGNTVDIEDIERRLALLRGVPYDPNALKKRMDEGRPEETEAEETSRIVKQYLEEAKLDDLVLDPEEQELIEGVPQAPKKDTEELPFCEICNEDAVCRCVGCDGNLFCKPCFKEFHDEEDYKDHKVKDYRAPKSVD